MRNLVEPEGYPDLFRLHPPVDFAVDPVDGVATFTVDFDLLTTFEPATARRIRRLPFPARWLRWKTCFVGMAITEYAPLPMALSAKEVLRLAREKGARRSLTVIKDIPLESPFLSAADTEFARELTRKAREKGFYDLEGQALAYVPIDFGSVEEYLGRLSAKRRKDLRRKMKAARQLDIRVVPLGDASFGDEALLDEFHAMYRAVHAQSEIHFDLLDRVFFRALLSGRHGGGVVMLYHAQGRLAGYNICLINKDMLIDKYIGFRYPLAREYNLYFVSWLYNLQFCLDRGLRTYIAGWTDPAVKKSLGASFTFTRHLVWIGNPLLRLLGRPFKRLFEGDRRAMEK